MPAILSIPNIYRGGNRRYGQNDRGGYNNYPRNRDSYQNGYQDRRQEDWGRGNNRGGGAGGAGGGGGAFREDGGIEQPIRTNDRWQEPDQRDSAQQFGGKWKDDGMGGPPPAAGGGRSIRGGM